ncbi:MAG TPA: hypothetical protein VLV88_13665 [Terriglobales bacterium]|nr:hypothetical protein [Candidatus Bathyarchaeia archaeon]HUL17040.1 hypothetical protein [Terriglobales bacterium]
MHSFAAKVWKSETSVLKKTGGQVIIGLRWRTVNGLHRIQPLGTV